MKKTLRKLLAVVLSITWICSAVACGSTTSDETSSTSNEISGEASGEVSSEASDENASSSEVGSSDSDVIKVGLLTSSSGGTTVLDGYIADAFTMAVEEINAAGGVNGKQIEIYEEDYASDPATAVEKATKLIVNDGVSCIFGAVFSSVRIAVMDVVEEYDNLLIYPTDHEGLEQSDNIIYLGCIPNQQTAVVAPWIAENLGQKIYVIGNDYIYPRSTCAQAIEIMEANGCEIVGEEYLATDETDFANSIAKIQASGADVVYSVLVGDCINSFTMQFAQYGIEGIDVFNVCMDESGAEAIGSDAVTGVYSGQTYYATIDTDINREFVEKINSEFGYTPTVYSSTSYSGAYMLAQALGTLGDEFSTEDLVAAYCKESFEGPAGLIQMNENHYASIYPRIGVAREDCLFDVLYEGEAIAPDPWAGEASATE